MPLKYAETIQKMTLEEKASLCSGHDYWHSEGVPSAGIPSAETSALRALW